MVSRWSRRLVSQYVDGLLMDGRYVGALFGHGGVEGFVARLAVYAIGLLRKVSICFFSNFSSRKLMTGDTTSLLRFIAERMTSL